MNPIFSTKADNTAVNESEPVESYIQIMAEILKQTFIKMYCFVKASTVKYFLQSM